MSLSLLAPLGRFLLVLMFIVSGLQKIPNYAGTQGYMEAMGVPGWLLPLVIVLEVLGGLSVLLEYRARVAAFLLAGFCILSAFLFHLDFSNQMQTIMLMKNIAIAGGFLMISAMGPGPYSLENRIKV